jgi:hypothetical protein
MRSSLITGVIAAGIVICTGGASAQQAAPMAHSLKDGAWALQFAIAENLSLRHFSGGVISARHQRAEGRAFRYGLTVAAEHTSGSVQTGRIGPEPWWGW